MCIDAVKRTVLPQKREGTLGADSLDAGNIVRRIAHQCLEIDDLFGRNAFLLIKIGQCQTVKIAYAALGHAYARVRVDELIAVAVSRIDERLRLRKFA